MKYAHRSAAAKIMPSAPEADVHEPCGRVYIMEASQPLNEELHVEGEASHYPGLFTCAFLAADRADKLSGKRARDCGLDQPARWYWRRRDDANALPIEVFIIASLVIASYVNAILIFAN